MIRPDQEPAVQKIVNQNLRRMFAELNRFCTEAHVEPWDIDAVLSSFDLLSEWWEATRKEANQAAENGL